MKLQLTRPLAAFDTETTGKDTQTARIVELGIVIIYPDGTRKSIRMLFNPECDIPAEVTAIHGITNEMVADMPTFAEKAKEISFILEDVDFLTFNGNKYDIPLLNAEFVRSGVGFNFADKSFIDVGSLYKILNERTLTAAHLQYVGEPLEGAHGALADTEATINVFDAMLEKHPELNLDIEAIALKSNFDKKRCDIDGKFNYNSQGVIVFTFGKHKDQPAFKEVPYLNWMLDAKDKETEKPVFSHDTRQFIGLILKGKSTDTDFKTVEHTQVFKRY